MPPAKVLHLVRHGHAHVNSLTEKFMAHHNIAPENVSDLFMGALGTDLQQQVVAQLQVR